MREEIFGPIQDWVEILGSTPTEDIEKIGSHSLFPMMDNKGLLIKDWPENIGPRKKDDVTKVKKAYKKHERATALSLKAWEAVKKAVPESEEAKAAYAAYVVMHNRQNEAAKRLNDLTGIFW